MQPNFNSEILLKKGFEISSAQLHSTLDVISEGNLIWLPGLPIKIKESYHCDKINGKLVTTISNIVNKISNSTTYSPGQRGTKESRPFKILWKFILTLQERLWTYFQSEFCFLWSVYRKIVDNLNSQYCV